MPKKISRVLGCSVNSQSGGNQTAWLKTFISFYKTNSWATSLEGLCCGTPRILPRLRQGTRSLKQSSTDRTAGSTSAWLNAFIILEICCHSWNDVRAILGSASTVATTVTRKHIATRPMGRTFEGCSLRRKRTAFSGWPGVSNDMLSKIHSQILTCCLVGT